MKTRYSIIVLMVFLQTCSPTMLAEECAVQAVDNITDNKWQVPATPPRPAAQEERIYKWTNEYGDVWYGDCLPPRFAECAKTVPGDKVLCAESQEVDETASQQPIERDSLVMDESQLRADAGLLESYMSAEGLLDAQRYHREDRCTAQQRVTRLYLRNLQRRLGRLETAANTTDADEALIQDIRDTREIIEGVQYELQRLQDNSEHCHDNPGQNLIDPKFHDHEPAEARLVDSGLL